MLSLGRLLLISIIETNTGDQARETFFLSQLKKKNPLIDILENWSNQELAFLKSFFLLLLDFRTFRIFSSAL